MKPFDLLANAGRAREILSVLVRYGFAGLVDSINLPTGFLQRLRTRVVDRRPLWERVRLAAEDLGPTFVKAGQLLSMRPDLVPQPLILEMRKLQDRVQALPFEQIRPVIERELEGTIEELFSAFDERPVAAGSLAQVYFATLRENGAEVAVKVQRPGAARVVELDLEIAHWIAGQIHARVATLAPYNLPGVIDELRTGLLQELDFRNEARNQTYFNSLNPFPEQVFAPSVQDSYSTDRVLVMQRVAGIRVDEAAAVLPKEQAAQLAATGARSLLDQILSVGFFHADPHAGNVLVTPDGRLCLLDWGLAGNLTKRMRLALADLFIAAARQDAEGLVAIAASLAAPSATPDLRSMERDMTLALREHFNPALPRQEIGRFILKALHVFGSNGISLTQDYALMAKAVFATEEVARILDPHFDLAQAATPVLKAVQGDRWKVRSLWREALMQARGMLGHFRELPSAIERVIRRVEAENLTVNFQHRGLEEVDEAINSASNRLTLAIIIAALIVGSSLIITTGIRPHILGYPALGIVGYIFSAILGLWVVVDILRHGRHK